MERISVSNNFFLDEFVDPYTFFNEVDNGLSLIDKKLIDCVQLLREKHGKPIRINNWWAYYIANKDKKTIDEIISDIEKSKTISKWSGLRTERSKIGAPASAHRLGKGADPKGNSTELLKVVEDNAKEFYNKGLRRLEDIKLTPTWLHMDTMERNVLPNHINVVDLKSVVRRIKC
jgi:hypothetical protein